MTPRPSALVPGIQHYPELMQQLAARLARAGCCDHARIAATFREKLAARQARDKALRGG